MKDNSNDDILLKGFLANNKQEIADNGFTEKVLQKVQFKQTRGLIYWIEPICVIVATLLFLLLGGAKLIINLFSNLQIPDISGLFTTSHILIAVAISSGVLLFLGFYKQEIDTD